METVIIRKCDRCGRAKITTLVFKQIISYFFRRQARRLRRPRLRFVKSSFILLGSLQPAAVPWVHLCRWRESVRAHLRHSGHPAGHADMLARAAAVLLACEVTSDVEPGRVHLIREAFALADPDIQEALAAPVQRLRAHFGGRLCETSLQEIDDDAEGNGFQTWYDTFYVLQWAEIESSLGAWIAAAQPVFGPVIAGSFDLPKSLDRRRVSQAAQRREKYYRRLMTFLGPTDLLCVPTAPALAPLKAGGNYYPRALSLTSVAGLGRLPQVSLPLGECAGLPVGLSLLAAHGRDAFLLGIAEIVAAFAGT